MAQDDRITLVIEGLPEDEGRVRLSAFMAQLQSLSAAITKLDRNASDGRQATYFRIIELSYRSPVKVVLEPHALPNRPYTGHLVTEMLGRIAEIIGRGETPTGFDADVLQDIRALSQPVGKTVKNAALIVDSCQFERQLSP